MLILQNEKTKEIKRVYTGREIITAMGKKYQHLHELYKEHYDTHFDLFSDESEGYIPITKMSLFESEEEFYSCLAEGNNDIYRIERLNKKKFKDKNGKCIKVKNINELKKYRNNLLRPIYLTISYGLAIALGITIGKFIIILMETYLR